MLILAAVFALALQGAVPDQGPPLPPAAERVLELGHPNGLRLTGTVRLEAASVLAGLKADHGFFEASHPAQRLDAYLSWLEDAVTLGYQHLGFGSVVVEVRAKRASGTVEIAVREGPQLLAGAVLLEGGQLLDAEWLRAVLAAGDSRRIAGAHLPVPPGPPQLEPALGLDTGKPMPRAFWVAGEPAPLSGADRLRFEGLALEAAHAAGLRAGQLSVRWDRVEDDAIHPVLVIEEGPLRVVERVRPEGDFGDPPQVLLDWAAIPPGTPANEAVLQAAAERVQATGRFGSVRARYAPHGDDPTRVELVLQVVEAPTVPALEQQPVEDLALLRRAMVRLSEGSAHPLGLDVRLTLSGEMLRPVLSKGAALGFPLRLVDGDCLSLRASVLREFAALELLLLHEGAAPLVLVRLYGDDQSGRASCPPLGVHLVFPALQASWWLDVAATYATPRAATDKGFDLSLSGGVGTGTPQPSSPLSVSLGVSPSALLYLYLQGAPPAEPDPERLVRLGTKEPAHVRATVERADARSRLEIDFESEALTGSVEFGDLQGLGPPAWASSREPATVPAIDDILAAVEALRAPGPPSGTAGVLDRPERVLLLAGLQAFVSAVGSERDAVREPTAPFFIPRPTSPKPEARSGLRDQAERVALGTIAQLPRGGWCADLIRAAPFLLFPASQDELILAHATMAELAGRDDLGPLGAWWAAELCALAGQPGWAANLARVGRRDPSSAAFLADCGSLLDLDTGSTARAVGRAWRELHARASDEAEVTLSREEREMLKATFAALKPGDEPGAWLRAGLARLWDTHLRDLVERRLATLAGTGR